MCDLNTREAQGINETRSARFIKHVGNTLHYASLRVLARCESLLTLAVMDGKPFSHREPVYCRHVYNLRAT